MATRTISAAGGNWNSTATWVGGVIPTTADDIVGDATSGNLVVNITPTIRFANFSAYTGTLTINSGFEFRINGGLATDETSFNTGMTISGVGFIFHGNGRFRSNGLVIPNLALTFNGTTTTLMDDVSVINYQMGLGNVNKTINGFQLNITNYTATLLGAGTFFRANGTTIFNFNAANCNYTTSATTAVDNSLQNQIIIDTPGNFTITGFLNLAAGTTLNYLQGNILGDKIIRIYEYNGVGNTPTTTSTINTSGITWDYVWINNVGSQLVAPQTDTYSFSSNFSFGEMVICNIINTSFVRFTKNIIFTGVGNFNGNSLSAYGFTSLKTGNSLDVNRTPNISFSTGATYNIGELNVIGTNTARPAILKSNTPGVKATLNLTGNTQGIFYTDITDIDASGGNTIYTYDGTISNSDNVLSVSTYVPTSSNTFLNG
jgi:hypothetical protein